MATLTLEPWACKICSYNFGIVTGLIYLSSPYRELKRWEGVEGEPLSEVSQQSCFAQKS